ncbi:MAG: hypothetical protein AB7I27_00945 [Bacteriovoracaceae bacterium]
MKAITLLIMIISSFPLLARELKGNEIDQIKEEINQRARNKAFECTNAQKEQIYFVTSDHSTLKLNLEGAKVEFDDKDKIVVITNENEIAGGKHVQRDALYFDTNGKLKKTISRSTNVYEDKLQVLDYVICNVE